MNTVTNPNPRIVISHTTTYRRGIRDNMYIYVYIPIYREHNFN
jgi:hypothetical protein